jgi:hypothetical protein
VPRSIIALPPSASGNFTVYLNGVAQEEDADFRVEASGDPSTEGSNPSPSAAGRDDR